MIAVTIAAVLFEPRPAAAQVCDNALSLRIGSQGLSFVAEEVKAFAGRPFEVPRKEQVVVDSLPLSGEPAVLIVPAFTLEAELDQVELTVEGDRLRLRLFGSAAGYTPFDLDKGPILGVSECEADWQISGGVELAAGLRAGSDGIEVYDPEVSLDFLDADGSGLDVQGCTLGSIVVDVLSFLREHLAGAFRGLIEHVLEKYGAPRLQQRLNEMIAFSGDTERLSYEARVDEMHALAGGLELSLAAGIELKLPADGLRCSVPAAGPAPPPHCGVDKPELDSGVDAMVAAGVGKSLLEKALHSLWSSGRLCIDSEQFDEGSLIDRERLNQVAVTLKQTPGTEVSVALHVHQPPELRLLPDEAALHLRGVSLELLLTPPFGVAKGVVVTANLSIAMAPTFDPRAGSIGIDLRQLNVEGLRIESHNRKASLPLDPAAMERFIGATLVPLLQQRLADAQLTPTVIGVGTFVGDEDPFSAKRTFLEAKTLELGDGYVAAYVDLHRFEPEEDGIEPETLLVEGPDGLVGPDVVTLYVDGEDDLTPARLLRYSYRLDQGEWSEPSFSRRVDVVASAAADGPQSRTQRVQIVAVDLHGNRDESPLEIVYEVDPVPPTVQITEGPSKVVEDGRASVRFVGKDDRTDGAQLAFRAQLFRVPDGGGLPVVVRDDEFIVGSRHAAFEGIGEGVYRIQVAVRDEAGNMASDEVGFTIISSGGCAVADGHLAGGAQLGPGLWVLLLGARRRRW